MLETLRIRPPIPALDRVNIEDTEIGGYVIPKGSCLHLSFMSVHLDPKYWKDPENFLPGI